MIRKKLKQFRQYVSDNYANTFLGAMYMTFTRPDESLNNKDAYDEKEKLYVNVLDDRPGTTIKDHRKKFKLVQIIFGYRILKPAIYLIEKLLSKYLVKKIANNNYNKSLIVFNRAFTESLKDWRYYYQMSHEQREKKQNNKITFKAYSIEKMLVSMKRIMFTMLKNDSAYKHLFDFLMLNIAKEVHKEYGSNPKHFLYKTPAIDDARYFILSGTLNESVMVQIAENQYIAIDKERAITLEEIPGHMRDKVIVLKKDVDEVQIK